MPGKKQQSVTVSNQVREDLQRLSSLESRTPPKEVEFLVNRRLQELIPWVEHEPKEGVNV